MPTNPQKPRGLLGLLLTLAATTGMADEPPLAPPDELVYCTVCHGVQLKGNHVIQAPRLSGMEAWYARRQLLAFSKGWRGTHETDLVGMEMQPMAAALSDGEIERAAQYVAAVGSEAPPDTVDGDAQRGRSIYATCAACHGADGHGNEALNGPGLTGLNDWYVVRQLRNFRDGTRGSHADDSYGAQMRAAAQVLDDDAAIYDVATYINTLQDK